MKLCHTQKMAKTLITLSFTLFFFLMLVGPGLAKPSKSQGPPFPFPGGKKGQEAISALQDRLPAVASRYGKSAEKLKKIFLQDDDIWLDPADNLLYLCSFGGVEADPVPESADGAIPTGPFPLDQTFMLHSLAGSSRVIYLDFDGHVASGTLWNSNFNGGADINSVPYDFDGNTGSFSDSELSRIQKIWARVAEDFAMYNIDVTTEDPGTNALLRSGPGDDQYGIRVVISPTSSWYGNAGGVAYIGSFDWSSDTAAYVFSDKLGNGNENYVAEATSHETGHTLGLNHDGTTSGTTYYAGHGNWAPIMGNSYYKAVTHWSKGEYAGANNTEDDLAVMLNNGASYRPDDHGDWIDSATMLSGDSLSAPGLIERTGDMDVFGFQAAAGNLSINVDPANLDPNLDILVQVLDDGGNIINEDDPDNILPASLDLNLPAGTYYILIDGVGTGDPNSGYSDFSSLGQYFVSVTLPTPEFPPDAPAGLTADAVSSSQITLNWADNSSNENGFSIERSPGSANSWEEVGYTAANVVTYTDTGLTLNTTYDYRVAAYNTVGSSGYSNTASATTLDPPPAKPTNLAATAVSADQINLNWTDNSSNETGFALERSANGVNGWEPIATVINKSDYSDKDLAPGTPYFYRVAAYNQNGSSDFSNTANATTAEELPDSPTNLSAAINSTNQVELSWQDASSNETGFKVERSADGYDPWTEIAGLTNNVTTYTDASVLPATTYYYRVFSHNSAGNSGYSNTAVASTDEPPQFFDQVAAQEAAVDGSLIGTFVNTQANDSTAESITESTSGGRPSKRQSYLEHKWLIPIQPGASMTLFANVWAPVSAEGDTFVFAYSTDDENYTDMFTVGTDFDDDSYHIYPLPENLSGTIYIRVTDTFRSPGSYDKDTIYIDHLFIRTDNDPGSLPADPSDLLASSASFDAIDLSWNDNADNETGFFIERSADGLGGWEQVGSTGPDTVVFTDSGLSQSTAYFYRVQAFNGAGTTGYTAPASATTGSANALHIETIESYAEQIRNRWNAFVTTTVYDQEQTPIAGVTVEGTWSDGKNSSAVTDANGQCTFSRTKLKTSVTSVSFTVTGLVKNGFVYDAGSNASSSTEVLAP